jgi:16S rRNA (cytosine1402-N4)-methyltransferase
LTEPFHQPVLLGPVLQFLRPRPGAVVVDATLGGGGHAEAILAELGAGGRLIGIDQDEEALEAARQRLGWHPGFRALAGSFADLPELLSGLGQSQVDGILMDLGVSSHHLDTPERGFSFRFDAPLDMRMDRSRPLRAEDLVANLSEDELKRIIREYGEERYAGRIARRIVEERRRRPIRTTGRLAEVVLAALPPQARHGQKIHPATRTFQALRMAVNQELEALQQGLEGAVACLAPQGRLVVISYHSLEDRLVKQTMRRYSGQCVCPPGLPACRCQPRSLLKVLTRKPIQPDETEIAVNPRARSARLRAAEKLPPPGDPGPVPEVP